MFNVEQPLEVNEGYPAEVREVTDTYIRAHIKAYENTYDFDRITGIAVHQLGEATEHPLSLRRRRDAVPTDTFYINAGKPDWDKSRWVRIHGAQHTYSDGKEAAAAVKQLNAASGPYRFMVKKEVREEMVSPVSEWAAERFACGRWKPLPWADEPWVKDLPAHLHAHRSCADPERVAYYAGTNEADQDYVSNLAPGRFLNNYAPHLSPSQVQAWVLAMDLPCEVHFADTPEDITRVYEKGPRSCMAGRAADYADGHPCRIYGAGDLAVAYMTRGDKITARALCWPANKIYGRLYGDIDRLKRELKNRGYNPDASESHDCSGEGRGGFNGAKMLRIEYGSGFVMPYLDLSYGFSEQGEYLIMDIDGDYSATNTDGTSCGRRVPCYACGDSVDPEDDAYDLDGDWYCYDCYTDRACGCDRCGTHYNADASGCTTGDGQHLCDYCTDTYSAECDVCDERFRTDDLIHVCDQDVCQSCRDSNFSECEHCEETFDNSDLTNGHCSSCQSAAPEPEPETSNIEQENA